MVALQVVVVVMAVGALIPVRELVAIHIHILVRPVVVNIAPALPVPVGVNHVQVTVAGVALGQVLEFMNVLAATAVAPSIASTPALGVEEARRALNHPAVRHQNRPQCPVVQPVPAAA